MFCLNSNQEYVSHWKMINIMSLDRALLRKIGVHIFILAYLVEVFHPLLQLDVIMDVIGQEAGYIKKSHIVYGCT